MSTHRWQLGLGIIGIIIRITWGLYYRRRALRWLNENIIIFWPLYLVVRFAVWAMDLMCATTIGVFLDLGFTLVW